MKAKNKSYVRPRAHTVRPKTPTSRTEIANCNMIKTTMKMQKKINLILREMQAKY